MSEKDIYIKLTETQASTLLRIAETHPDASKWGAKGTRNAVMSEIRNALSAEVREGGEHDGDWAEWSTSLTGQDIATPDDIRADFGLLPTNPLREDLTADDLEQASTGKPAQPDETPYEGDDAADGQVDEGEKNAEDGLYNEADGTYDELFQNTGEGEPDVLGVLGAEEQREDVISDESAEGEQNEDTSNNS